MTADAIAILRADHRAMKALFSEFEKAATTTQGRIAAEICAALTAHSQIEEEILYPASRTILGAGGADMLDAALVEHGIAADLIEKIEASSPEKSLFFAWVKVLGEYIQHHMTEEENELFPKLRDSDMDLDEVGAKLASRKAELAKARAHDTGRTQHISSTATPPATRQRQSSDSDAAKNSARA